MDSRGFANEGAAQRGMAMRSQNEEARWRVTPYSDTQDVARDEAQDVRLFRGTYGRKPIKVVVLEHVANGADHLVVLVVRGDAPVQLRTPLSGGEHALGCCADWRWA